MQVLLHCLLELLKYSGDLALLGAAKFPQADRILIIIKPSGDINFPTSPGQKIALIFSRRATRSAHPDSESHG